MALSASWHPVPQRACGETPSSSAGSFLPRRVSSSARVSRKEWSMEHGAQPSSTRALLVWTVIVMRLDMLRRLSLEKAGGTGTSRSNNVINATLMRINPSGSPHTRPRTPVTAIARSTISRNGGFSLKEMGSRFRGNDRGVKSQRRGRARRARARRAGWR
jgi:hypothetical protein